MVGTGEIQQEEVCLTEVYEMELSTFYAVVNRARAIGERRITNGTMLLGHVPHVAPEAWLHALYSPIVEAEIGAIERALLLPLPPGYAAFLRLHNGLRIFSGDLWIGGYRTTFSRIGDAVWQPFSIVSANQEHAVSSDNDEFVIGGEERTGATIRYSRKDGIFRKYKARSTKPLDSWETLENVLNMEASRLATCYDASGRRV